MNTPVTATLIALLLNIPAACLAEEDSPYPLADAEMHYVNFMQESDGMEKLIQAMDQADVTDTMLTGMAVTKKWKETAPERPRYYQGDDGPVYWYAATDELVARAIEGLPKEQQKRFHPFLSGFNPTDLNAVDHIERMLQWRPGFWQGIGEVLTRHDDLTALTEGEKPRANHQAMHRVYRLAAKHHLPVLLHANITSAREDRPLYLKELKEALTQNPNTTFIWPHAGTSATTMRRNDMDFLPPLVKQLLKDHDNLYILLSWTAEEVIYKKEGVPDPAWVKMVKRYPDRFMLGSDLVGRFDSLPKTMDDFQPFLDALPEPVARKVARENFLDLLPRNR